MGSHRMQEPYGDRMPSAFNLNHDHDSTSNVEIDRFVLYQNGINVLRDGGARNVERQIQLIPILHFTLCAFEV